MEASSMSSSTSSINKLSSESEESGWTIYLEDFFNSSSAENKNRSDHEDDQELATASANNNIWTAAGGSSVISDAASSTVVAWKSPAMPAAAAAAAEDRSRKRLSFKKRKAITRRVIDEDPFEDTATSPVNSPKVCETNPYLDLNERKKDGNSQEKDEGFENDTEMGREKIDGENECTGLKKRGLCLVPLSLLVDYLG